MFPLVSVWYMMRAWYEFPAVNPVINLNVEPFKRTGTPLVTVPPTAIASALFAAAKTEPAPGEDPVRISQPTNAILSLTAAWKNDFQ